MLGDREVRQTGWRTFSPESVQAAAARRSLGKKKFSSLEDSVPGRGVQRRLRACEADRNENLPRGAHLEVFMRYIKYIALCVLAASLLAVTGCANISGSAYSADQTRSAQTVQYGTVKSVHEVQVEGDTNGGLGAVGGGVAGGVLGSLVGGGSGRTVGAVVGALAGAGLGYAGEKAITKQNGLEIEVELDNGQILSIVQGNDQVFSVGERVRVLRASDGRARVSR